MLQTIYLCKSNENLKLTTATSGNCVYSNGLFSSKNNIFKFLRTQIFAEEANESLKTILYLARNISL